MTGKTHLVGGFAASLVLCHNYEQGLLLVLGSLLCDIDHPNSIIGKCVPFLPKMLKHRGITHSLLFSVLCYLISPYLCYGVLVHLFLDMLTKNGIKLLWPVDFSFRLPLARYVKTGGKFENLLFFMLWLGILYFLTEKYLVI